MKIFYFLLALSGLFAQSNTYFGPKTPSKNQELIRLEILVQDSLELGGVGIVSVSFNQTNVPLKPRDINGYRGGASFQIPPGEYPLEWVVQKDKRYWPRKAIHKEIVTVSPKDLWIQIKIVGDEATIN